LPRKRVTQKKRGQLPTKKKWKKKKTREKGPCHFKEKRDNKREGPPGKKRGVLLCKGRAEKRNAKSRKTRGKKAA